MVQRDAPHRSPSSPASRSTTVPFLPSLLHSSRKLSVVMEPALELSPQYDLDLPRLRFEEHLQAASHHNEVVVFLDRAHVGCDSLNNMTLWKKEITSGDEEPLMGCWIRRPFSPICLEFISS